MGGPSSSGRERPMRWRRHLPGTSAVLLSCTAFAAIGGSAPSGAVPPSTTLTTGTSWTFGSPTTVNETVPATTCSATFTVYGNLGGAGYENVGASGYGGEAEGTATVSAGEPYQLDVGGVGNGGGGTNSQGTITNPGGGSNAPGGEGAGGNAGGALVGDLFNIFAENGGGGGGASYLFLGTSSPTLSTAPLLVAGGGGGGGSGAADMAAAGRNWTRCACRRAR